ncbi:membrane protein [Streptomyces varsoviensis]|uniref:Membrane protein n=1 Tax=Streptomyces varsoviensis TaxID=67373 RepID=A0ABR5IR80_9ACTN|nr:membrane protein [Streptomyces varsoviensis]
MSDTPSAGGRAPAPDSPARAGDLLVRIGAIVFLVGAVAATVAPLFLGLRPLPSIAYAVCMLMGVGFVIAAAGVLRSIAQERRQARSLT